MSLSTAQKAIDFLHNHSIDSEVIVIGFYGGEPLLEFPLIRNIMEYSKKVFEGKNIIFTITSNASLLSNESMSYLNDNNVFLMISLDGPKSLNDTHRVFANKENSTFDTVIQKLNVIAEMYPSLKKNTTSTRAIIRFTIIFFASKLAEL